MSRRAAHPCPQHTHRPAHERRVARTDPVASPWRLQPPNQRRDGRRPSPLSRAWTALRPPVLVGAVGTDESPANSSGGLRRGRTHPCLAPKRELLLGTSGNAAMCPTAGFEVEGRAGRGAGPGSRGRGRTDPWQCPEGLWSGRHCTQTLEE